MIVVTGSIATDHLMTFPGRFAELILPENLASISLSFLADDLTVHRGGVAANIAYGIAVLGGAAVLVGAAGVDFDAGYRPWLEGHGVNCKHVRVSTESYTARFVCTTDRDLCQIATFYPGAMSEGPEIDLAAVVSAAGEPDLVLVGPETPAAMLRHAAACRRRGWSFAADPSQQLARMAPAEATAFIEGAAYVFTNEYEYELLLNRTGLTAAELGARVGVVVTTLGAAGVRLVAKDTTLTVPAVPVAAVTDPTGGGDAFRAGFLRAREIGLPLPEAAEAGCANAAAALVAPGGQGYRPATGKLPRWAAEGSGQAV